MFLASTAAVGVHGGRPAGHVPLTSIPVAHLAVRPGCVAPGAGLGRRPVLPPRVLMPRTAPVPATVSVQAPAAEETTEEMAAKEETFQWTKNWYPIIPLDMLEESQGQGFESGLPQIQRQAILGRDIVLWKDAEGKWRAVEDRCAHRLAALSLGSVQDDGTLACRYHGWCFNGRGQCTRIPQAVDTVSEAAACASSRSEIQAFPTVEAHGLLWVWPDDSPSAWEDAAAQEPISGKVNGPKAKWNVLDMPLSYNTSVENIVDPSHGNFAHEGRNFFGSRFSPGKSRPIDKFKALQRASARGFMQFDYSSPSKAANGADHRVAFQPPTLAGFQFEGHGRDTRFELHWVPCRPGLTRVLFSISVERAKQSTETEKGFFEKTISAIKMFPLIFGLIRRKIVPKFLMHIYPDNVLPKQDTVVLHSEDLEYFRSGKSWQQQFYLPTLSDVGVVNFRQWLTRYAGGGPKWHGGQSEKEAIENMKYSDLFNTWELHTKYCPTCRKTLKALGFLDSVLPKAAFCLLGAAAIMLSFRTAEPRLAVVALAVAGIAMLVRYELQKIRARLLSDVPSDGIPEFSFKWGS